MSEDPVSSITTNYFPIVRMTSDWQGKKSGQMNANDIQAPFGAVSGPLASFIHLVSVFLRAILASCWHANILRELSYPLPFTDRNKRAQT